LLLCALSVEWNNILLKTARLLLLHCCYSPKKMESFFFFYFSSHLLNCCREKMRESCVFWRCWKSMFPRVCVCVSVGGRWFSLLFSHRKWHVNSWEKKKWL
jgi:hypothetical protein